MPAGRLPGGMHDGRLRGRLRQSVAWRTAARCTPQGSWRAVLSSRQPSPSTKTAFLCAFTLRNHHFEAFRAQKQHFCARGSLFRGGARDGLLWDSARGVLLLLGSCCSGCGAVYLLAARRAKSSFLKVAASLKSSACMPAAMAPSTLAGLSSVKRHSEALSPNFWQSRS